MTNLEVLQMLIDKNEIGFCAEIFTENQTERFEDFLEDLVEVNGKCQVTDIVPNGFIIFSPKDTFGSIPGNPDYIFKEDPVLFKKRVEAANVLNALFPNKREWEDITEDFLSRGTAVFYKL